MLPDGAFRRKVEALDQPDLQGHIDKVSYQPGHSYNGKSACGSSACAFSLRGLRDNWAHWTQG